MDQELLNLLLEKVALKFGYSDPEKWQDGLFGQLSEKIEKETKFLISKNTLKRLFGKIKTSDQYNPQIDTRNALAIYVGYEDWNKFRMQFQSEFNLENDPISLEEKEGSERSKIWPWFLAIAISIVAFLMFIRLLSDEKVAARSDFSKVKIHIQNPIDTAPYTLIVDYEIPEEIKDSLYLGVGGSKFLLDPKKKTFIHSIVRPIYSFVYLSTNKKVIKALPIRAFSRGWECFFEDDKHLLAVAQKHYLSNGFAGFKRSFFENSNLDSINFFFQMIEVKESTIDADNFVFQCRFKVDQSLNICHSFQLKIFADSGHHELEIFNKGCAQHIFVAPAEKYFGGKFENLTKLSTEAGLWHDLEIKVINKKFQISIDSTKRFKSTYKRTMGLMKVIKFQINGFGQIDLIRMKDKSGKVIEEVNF